MIKIQNISKYYKEKLIVHKISFEVKPSELAVIYGVNGSGKTTIIKMITGLISKNSGNVNLIPSNKNKISIFLGHEMLITKLTVKEYLFFVGKLKETQEIEEKILSLSLKLNFDKYLNELIMNLSFGTKTKVLFAACLINEPKILIMDEPFIGVDLITLQQLVKILSELKHNGCTIFISSHQVDILEKITDKIIILKDNEIILDEYVKNISFNNSNELTSFILSKL